MKSMGEDTFEVSVQDGTIYVWLLRKGHAYRFKKVDDAVRAHYLGDPFPFLPADDLYTEFSKRRDVLWDEPSMKSKEQL